MKMIDVLREYRLIWLGKASVYAHACYSLTCPSHDPSWTKCVQAQCDQTPETGRTVKNKISFAKQTLLSAAKV